MEKEITFFDRDGRSYIKVKITDRFGNRNWYNCGYIAEGKYSSKCKFGDYYRVMSLFRPNYGGSNQSRTRSNAVPAGTRNKGG